MENVKNLRIYDKIMLNAFLTEDTTRMNHVENSILDLIEDLITEKKVKVNLDILNSDFSINRSYNAVLIDLEGTDPLKLFGFIFRRYQIMIGLKTLNHVRAFYDALYQLLLTLKGMIFFAFSSWDYNAIMELRDSLFKYGYEHSRLRFFQELIYFNLQRHDKESLVESLYSMNLPIPTDPLYRDSSKINNLYKDGYYDIIARHNSSCLKGAAKIMTQRYLKIIKL